MVLQFAHFLQIDTIFRLYKAIFEYFAYEIERGEKAVHENLRTV